MNDLVDYDILLKAAESNNFPAPVEPNIGLDEFADLGLAPLNERPNDDAIQYATPENFANQFMVFQLGDKEGDEHIIEASSVIPKLQGSDEKPDIQMSVQMQSMHLGSMDRQNVDSETRLTMRVDLSKDENSRDRWFETVFWSVTAGIQLYEQYKRPEANSPREVNIDLNRAFGNRPIEIPGGLANLKFEVIKHREPGWWQNIFKFFESDSGKKILSVLGFPGVTSAALRMVDELVQRIRGGNAEVLFESKRLRLALSQQAHNDYTCGSKLVKMGVLNPGFCVLARGKDYQALMKSKPYYYPHLGVLIPSDISVTDALRGGLENSPLHEITYAVFKVGMRDVKLNPNLLYG